MLEQSLPDFRHDKVGTEGTSMMQPNIGYKPLRAAGLELDWVPAASNLASHRQDCLTLIVCRHLVHFCQQWYVLLSYDNSEFRHQTFMSNL